MVTTIAGTGTPGFSGDGGPAAQAALNGVIGVCLDPGDLYVSDDANNRIRRITPAGAIPTVAGNGVRQYGGDGSPATQASFNIGIRCASDANGNIYVAEHGAHRIRRIATSGMISTIAGTGARAFRATSTAAPLNNPTALTVDRGGNIYFSDPFNRRIRRISAAGAITIIAGTGTAGFSGDGGAATSANLNFPGGMVTDSRRSLLHRWPQLAGPQGKRGENHQHGGGQRQPGFSGDGGAPLNASFNGQFGIAIEAQGDL